MNKETILVIARQVLNELGYDGWSVFTARELKVLAATSIRSAQGGTGSTWCIYYTTINGQFPKAHLQLGNGATPEQLMAELKDKLSTLKHDLDNQPPSASPEIKQAEPRRPLWSNLKNVNKRERIFAPHSTIRADLSAVPKPDPADLKLVNLSAKIMLTIPEASALTGLSRGHLSNAIHQEALKAKIIGRRWMIKRIDLDEYVRNL